MIIWYQYGIQWGIIWRKVERQFSWDRSNQSRISTVIKLYWLKMLRESQPALLLGKEKGEELGRESSNHQLRQEGALFQCAPLNPCLYSICRVISHVIKTTGDVNNYTIIFSHFFSQLHCVTSHHIFLCLKKATKACSLWLFGDFFPWWA